MITASLTRDMSMCTAHVGFDPSYMRSLEAAGFTLQNFHQKQTLLHTTLAKKDASAYNQSLPLMRMMSKYTSSRYVL